ncbi:hypothetical protein Q31b_39370 [Novipirellula aureliae]|uniref:Uncharacterized protein n=1 Tax=Novipirellula aureliae TaxID=2527966 RepID=A0A5C6DVN2_9BACT|nr:hypothetical protein Q31b_39370 [Novipirellula aureliae]
MSLLKWPFGLVLLAVVEVTVPSIKGPRPAWDRRIRRWIWMYSLSQKVQGIRSGPMKVSIGGE